MLIFISICSPWCPQDAVYCYCCNPTTPYPSDPLPTPSPFQYHSHSLFFHARFMRGQEQPPASLPAAPAFEPSSTYKYKHSQNIPSNVTNFNTYSINIPQYMFIFTSVCSFWCAQDAIYAYFYNCLQLMVCSRCTICLYLQAFAAFDVLKTQSMFIFTSICTSWCPQDNICLYSRTFAALDTLKS